MAASQVSTRTHVDYLDTTPATSALAERRTSVTDAGNTEKLQRQPSQQDLEIARQLQHFQSQNTVPQSHAGRDDNRQTENAHLPTDSASVTSPQPPNHNEQYSQEHPHQPASPVASDHSGQRTSPGPALTGQVCTNCGTTKTPLWRRSPAGAVICNACGLYYKARNQMRPVGLKRSAGTLAPMTNNQTSEGAQGRSTSPAPLQSGANYISTDQIADGTCPGGGRCNSQGGKLICQGCPSFNNRIAKAAQVALRQANDRGGTASDSATESRQPSTTSPQTVVVACQNCGTTVTPLWRRDEAGNAICNACGLYHKLHGHHRPVQMKKAEIKRRKRVVPINATSEHQNNAFNDHAADRNTIHDAQQQTSPSLQNPLMTVLEPRTGPSPIPVDFTDTFRSRSLQHHNSSEPQNVPNKRPYSSISNTGAESEPYAHAQNIGFSAINAIDPSLPSRDSNGLSNKEARRAELRREAEKMRAMLEEKERELAALADD